MKKAMLFAMIVFALPTVIADYGDMHGPGMMGGYWTGGWMIGGWLLGLLYMAIAAFIFSVIFWLTHNWLVKAKKGHKHK
jgi:hypothetical protein